MVGSPGLPHDGSMTDEHLPLPDEPTDSDALIDGSDTMTDQVPPAVPSAALPPPSAFYVADHGLTRDPYSTLGGVASGVAHRYGWSVPVVRLLFAAGFLASCGFATVLYLVAWVVIPRATVWPPTTVRGPGQGVRSRDLGIGIVVIGVLAFLIAGGGSAASFLVPLTLVLGGVWLLIQDQRDPAPQAAVAVATPPPPFGSFATPQPIGHPVPPRSRRSKWITRSLIGVAMVFLLALLAIPIGFFAISSETENFSVQVSTDEWDIGGAVLKPESLAELPDSITSDVGFLDLDLTNIPASEFDALEFPTRLDIDLDEGEIKITLPEGLDVSLVAEAADGSVDVDGAELGDAVIAEDRVEVEHADPDLILTITNGDGDIEIVTKD